MTKPPKNKATESPSLVEDSNTNFFEKRNWISPEIVNWKNEISNQHLGGGIDAGTKTYGAIPP